MSIRLRWAALPLSLLIASTACAPAEDWTDPRYVELQLRVGEERAFNEFGRLAPEAQAELVPVMIEVFNQGLRQRECVQALVGVNDPRAREVFLAALQRTDDSLAALAARGLAGINDTESAAAIAQRLTSVTSQDAFPGFMDALSSMPTPASADVIAGVLTRPAARIGGVATVRRGCQLLSSVDRPSDEAIGAMVFGLVNLQPQPVQDALKECELALLAHAESAVPQVGQLFRGENQRATQLLRSLELKPVVAQLRAAAVLADIHNDAANRVLIEWFSTSHPVPVAELQGMDLTMQQEWYDLHGQLFTVASTALALRGSDEDLATLRLLESSETEGNLLTNFSGWFGLSQGAEFGLRTAVHEGLARIGTDADREMLWQRATDGTVTRGGNFFAIELRKNLVHHLGRTARPGDLARYDLVVAAQPENERLQFAAMRSYFLVADRCLDDVSCYAQLMLDPAPVLTDAALTATLDGLSQDADKAMFREMIATNARAGAVWQMVSRFGDNAAVAEALLTNLGHPSLDTSRNIAIALQYVDARPADFGARIAAYLDANAAGNQPEIVEIRHLMRVAAAMGATGN